MAAGKTLVINAANTPPRTHVCASNPTAHQPTNVASGTSMSTSVFSLVGRISDLQPGLLMSNWHQWQIKGSLRPMHGALQRHSAVLSFLQAALMSLIVFGHTHGHTQVVCMLDRDRIAQSGQVIHLHLGSLQYRASSQDVRRESQDVVAKRPPPALCAMHIWPSPCLHLSVLPCLPVHGHRDIATTGLCHTMRPLHACGFC